MCCKDILNVEDNGSLFSCTSPRENNLDYSLLQSLNFKNRVVNHVITD